MAADTGTALNVVGAAENVAPGGAVFNGKQSCFNTSSKLP